MDHLPVRGDVTTPSGATSLPSVFLPSLARPPGSASYSSKGQQEAPEILLLVGFTGAAFWVRVYCISLL